jgi:hypothetical protein
MQFNSHATEQDIVSDITYWITGAHDGTLDYDIEDMTRNVNHYYDEAISLILESDGLWEWDDDNNTDLPIATSSLVANQRDYSFAGAGFLKILKIEVKNSAGNWTVITQTDQSLRKLKPIESSTESSGTPREFDLFNETLFLYPAPSYSSTGGIKVFYQRGAEHFETTDTTQEPGFASPFHRYLSIGAALDYCNVHGLTQKANMLESKKATMAQAIKEHYSTRNRNTKTRMTVSKEDYGNDNYLDDTKIGVNWS